MENRKQEDQDMLYVFKSIKKGIINLFNGIAWLLSFSLKKSLTLLVFIAVFVSLFLGLYSLQKPYYASELAVSHTRFDNDFCAVMIQNLGSYNSGVRDYEEIGRVLSMDVKEVEKIKSISYAPLNEHLSKRYADSTTMYLPFKVEVEVYDNSILDNLQKGILNYLETNEYAAKRKELEKQALDKTEERLMREILEADSLKRLVNQSIVPRGTASGIILGEPIDPVAVYKRSLDLYERKLYLNKKQTLNNSFEVIVGFTKRPTPANPGLLFYVFLGTLVGYVFGIIWLVSRQSRN